MSDIGPLPSWDSDATWRTFEDGQYHQYIGQVELQKHADDLARYAELIEISQPDLVVETGTRQGGSALWFREQGLQVISIDIDRDSGQAARRQEPDSGIQWLQDSSINPRVVEFALQQTPGKRVMVSLDSDHHSMHVQAELHFWAPLVSPGCYLVVEDTCFDMWPDERGARGGLGIPRLGGPLDAVRKAGLGQEYDCVLPLKRFWRDEALESLTPVTHSPAGWWRADD